MWEKPERFGDSDQIYLRQYKVNVTTDLKTVSDHAILTESDVFIPGMGVMRWIVVSPGAPEGLEQIDQTTPIGSPWESQNTKPKQRNYMAYKWEENEVAFTIEGVSIHHVYNNDMAEDTTRDYAFSTSAYAREAGDEVFDIRELPEVPEAEMAEVREVYNRADGDAIAKAHGLPPDYILSLCRAILRDELPKEYDEA